MNTFERACLSASKLERFGAVAWTVVAVAFWALPVLVTGKSWHPWWFPAFPSLFALGMWTKILSSSRTANQR